MTDKTLPLSRDQLEAIAHKYPTPFHIYDEKAIRENARRLLKLFAWNPGFKEFFAVKATPNPFILKILHSEGFRRRLQFVARVDPRGEGGHRRRGDHVFLERHTRRRVYRSAIA